MGSGKAMGTIKECYAYCNATKGCEGFVWDEIPGEISGQCKGKHGQGCCIVKVQRSQFLPFVSGFIMMILHDSSLSFGRFDVKFWGAAGVRQVHREKGGHGSDVWGASGASQAADAG